MVWSANCAKNIYGTLMVSLHTPVHEDGIRIDNHTASNELTLAISYWPFTAGRTHTHAHTHIHEVDDSFLGAFVSGFLNDPALDDFMSTIGCIYRSDDLLCINVDYVAEVVLREYLEFEGEIYCSFEYIWLK
jgi:hypothetical protein